MAGFMRNAKRRAEKRSLTQKILASLTAFGVMTGPWFTQLAAANAIEKADASKAGTITTNGAVTNVLADSVHGDNAVNTFKHFSLDQGHIANLYFGTTTAGGAKNLINFVNEAISINGTVNAVRANKVGGNLYFVSVDGMTVGASGVVNAGSIHVITPTKGGYTALQSSANDGTALPFASGEVAINPSGTISVAGKLNAVDGIRLEAATINLAGTAHLKTAPTIDFKDLVNTTDVHGNLVSANLSGNLVMDAEENGDIVLRAVADGLAMASDKGVEETFKDFAPRYRTATVTAEAGSVIEARSQRDAYTADEKSGGNVTIEARATSRDPGWSFDRMPEDLQTTIGSIDNPLGQIVYTKADIKLNGKIDANKIKVAATSTNSYNSFNDSTSLENLSGDIKALGHMGKTLTKITTITNMLKVDPIYSYMGSEANVSVGKKAVLTARALSSTDADAAKAEAANAKNPALSITAESKTQNIVQASTSSVDTQMIKPKLKPEKEQAGTRPAGQGPKVTNIAGAAVAYGGSDSKADIAIDGTLEAPGRVDVNAQSTNALVVKANANGAKATVGTEPLVNAAVAVATGHNDAHVTLGETSRISSTDNDVQVKSIAANSIDVAAVVKENVSAVAATAVADLTYKSNAALDMNGAVAATRYVVGAANNTTVRNNVTASNAAIGANPPPEQMKPEEAKNGVIEANRLQLVLQNRQKELKGELDARQPQEKRGMLQGLTQMFTLGTSVAVGVETNTATVNVGKTANIGITNKVPVTKLVKLMAENNMSDVHMSAQGGMVNTKDDEKTKVLADASALVSVIDNKAEVNVADGAEDTTDEHGKKVQRHANIQAGMVDISANSHQDYNRIKGLFDNLMKIYGGATDFINDVEEMQKLSAKEQTQIKDYVEQLGKLVNDLRSLAQKSTGLNIDNYVGNATKFPLSITNIITSALSLGAGIEQIVASKSQGFKYELNVALTSFTSQAMMFLTPENYANFGAAASVNTVEGDGGKLGISGAANVNFLTQTANVHIGDHAAVTALGGTAKIDARAEQTNVVMNGKPNVSIDVKNLAETMVKIRKEVEEIFKDPKKIANPAVMKNYQEDLTKRVKSCISMAGTDTAPVSVGGTLGVARHSTVGTVTVGAGARVTGAGLEIGAHNQNVTTDLSYSAGKSGTAGFEGMAAYLGGEGTSRITVDRSAALTAKALAGPKAGEMGVISLKSTANNVLTNLAGAVAWSQGAASVGAAGAVTDYNLSNRILAGGTYQGRSLAVNALTDGVVNTLSVAGSLTSDKAGKQGNLSAEETETAPLRPADVLQDEVAQPEARANEAAVVAQNTANENTQAAANTTANVQQGTTNDVAAQAEKNEKAPKVQIAGAGSFSLNLIDAETEAKLDGAHVKLFKNASDTTAGDVNMKAEDASFLGAWSGAAAVTWKQSAATKGVQNAAGEIELKNQHAQEGAATQLDNRTTGGANAPTTVQQGDVPQDIEQHTEKVKVALAGAAALNVANQKVHSFIEGATIENANDVRNIAQKDGASAAAALALSLTKAAAEGETVSFGGAGAFSFNKAENEISAKISGTNTSLNGLSGSLYNLAYSSDTQIAGGINTNLMFGGKMAVGAGGTLAVSDLKNDVTAELAGGSYRLAGDVINHAATDDNQITTAIGVSAVVGAKSGVSFEGALASSSIKNDTKAHIEGADIGAGAGKKVDNAAYDADDLNKTFDKELLADGLDPSGLTYRENAEKNAATNGEGKVALDTKAKGSTKLITTALAASANLSSKGVGGAGAAAVSVLQNTTAARIEKSKIAADTLNNIASSDALLINTAGGAAVGSGHFSGAGSVSVQSTSDTTKAEMEDSDVEAQHTAVQAETKNVDVNVAGQVSAGKGGAGLAVAFNHLNNATRAHILGTSVEGNAHDVTVAAANSGTTVSVSAAVSGGSKAAVAGALALTQGKDTTLAGIGESESTNRRSRLVNVNRITVDAKDSTTKVAVAGGLSGAGTAAVGGAIAYNQVGGVGYQTMEAFLNDTDITTKGYKSAIRVHALDEATLGTAAAGIGGAGTAAVQGAAATSNIEKDVRTQMKGTNVQNAAGEVKGSLSLKAESLGSMYTNTLVLAGSGTAAVGAGVSVTTALGSTRAELSGGQQDVGGAEVRAASKNKVLTIGIGGAGAGTAGVAGSVAVNVQNGETTAKITGGAQLDAAHDVVVAATSDRAVDTYAGVLSAAGVGAAVGLSSVVNTIKTTTNALVEGNATKNATKVKANAEAYDTAKEDRVSSEVQDKAADNAIVNDYVNTTSNVQPATYIERQKTDYQGVAVTASSTNKINTIATNANFVGEGAAVSGNVAVNTIGGATTAMVDKAQIESGKDVAVAAHDYANNFSFLGTAAAGGLAGSVGLASNTTTINRETTATVQGLGRAADIRARNLRVEALAKHGVANFDIGISGAAVGVASLNDVTLLKSKTKAGIWNANAVLSGDFSLYADHDSRLHVFTLAMGGGAVGAELAVDVVKGESETETALEDAKISFTGDGTSNVSVLAKNHTENHYKQLSQSVAGVAAAGSVGVSNFNDTVRTHLQNATIGAADRRARQIDVKAENDTLAETRAYQGTLGLANVGVGVNVATLDSQTETSIKGGSLFSKGDLTVAANEHRDTSLDTMNFGVSAGGAAINTAVVTAGHEVEDEYKATGGKKADGSRTTVNANVGKAYKDANDVIRKGTLKSKDTFGAVSSDAKVVAAERGGKKSQVSASIKDAHLSAGEKLSVTSTEINKLDFLSASAGLQGLLANGIVSVANVARNAFLDITNSRIEGRSVEAEAKIGGKAQISSLQGGISLAAAAAAVSVSDWDGEVRTQVAGGSLRATDGTITVRARNAAKTETQAKAGNVSAAAGSLMVAEMHAHGSTVVDVGNGGVFDAGKEKITLEAKNEEELSSKTVVGNIALGAGDISVVKAMFGAAGKAVQTTLAIGSGNTFRAGAMDAVAQANLKSKVDLVGVNVGSIALGLNNADSGVYSDVSVTAGKNVYGSKERRMDSLRLRADNIASHSVTAQTANEALAAGLGNNWVRAADVFHTTVTAAGMDKASRLKDAAIEAAARADVTASSTSFGGVSVGENIAAAELDQSLTSDTTTTISGEWELEGDLKASATNHEKLKLKSDTSSAALLDASGAGLSSVVHQKAVLDVSGAAIRTKGAQRYTAGNRFENESWIYSGGYGGVADASAKITQDRAYEAAIRLRGSTLDADGEISAQAATTGSAAANHGLSAAGVMPTTVAMSDFKTRYENSVEAADSHLATSLGKGGAQGGAITLAAGDDTLLNYATTADNQFGVMGYATTYVKNALTRSNDVRITGSSEIAGGGAVNLYAGRNAGGAKSNLQFNLLSDVYNRALIPLDNRPYLQSKISQKNTVTLAQGAKVSSVGNLNFAADKAQERIDQTARRYTFYTGSDNMPLSTTETGEMSAQKEYANGVTIDGKAVAGRHNSTEVEISGTVKKKSDGTLDYSGVKITVSEGSGVSEKDFKLGTAKMENGLWGQYQSLLKRLQEYQPGTAAYNAYQTAMENLLNAMKAQGFAAEEDIKDANGRPTGNKTLVVYHYLTVPAVKTPGLTVLGGHVQVEADELKVNAGALLTAQGAPTISIRNETPLYLLTGDAVISQSGGKVYYNGQDISAKAGTAQKVSGVEGVENIRADAAAAGKTGAIDITSTSAGMEGVRPLIDIRGKVSAGDGDVCIKNEHGSVHVEGTAEISGKSVKISAEEGAVVQNNPSGIINVGGDPIVRYMIDKETADKIQKALDTYMRSNGNFVLKNFANYEAYRTWVKNNLHIELPAAATDEKAGIHAGQMVYINAHEVNINGLVQSGYSSYTAVLDASDRTKVEDMDRAWQQPLQALDDASVRGNANYLVRAGGAVYDTTEKAWKYQVAVYYNPSSKQLLLDSVKADGGQVYISGRVGSTGGGRILAADGAAKISADVTAVDRALALSSIENKDRKGTVSIMDPGHTGIEYTNPQKLTGNIFTFNPNTKLVYQWTGGVATDTTTTKSYKDERYVGFIHFKSPQEIKDQVSADKIKTVASSAHNGDTLGTSSFFAESNNSQSKEYQIKGAWRPSSHEESPMTKTKEEHGLFGLFHSTYTYTWTEYDGSSSTSTYSLKASNPVSVGFLRAAVGEAGVDVKATGDVMVGGDVRATADTFVKLTSEDGSVRGGGVLRTDNLTVRAQKDIDLQHAALEQGSKAKVYLASTTGSIDLSSLQGDLALRALAGFDDSMGSHAVIRARGSLTNAAANGESVLAQRIELSSETGTIGTTNDALRVRAGSAAISGDPTDAGLSAAARGNIHLAQVDGDMRVNRITSAEGDVVLDAAGHDIIAADRSEPAANTAGRRAVWEKAGLISSADSAEEKADAARLAREKRENAAQTRLGQLAKKDNAKLTAYKGAAQDYNGDTAMQAARSNYISAMKAATTEAEKKAARETFQNARQAYFSAKGYTAKEGTAIANYAEVTRADNDYGWTKNQLLYAVADRLINSQPGEVSLQKTANVSGRNIVLNAKNIGEDSEATILKADLARPEKLKILSEARVGDITKNYDSSGHFVSLTVRQKTPLTVQTAADGGVSANSTGHVYLASLEGEMLRIKGGIDAGANEVKLLAGTGITAEGLITAKDLTLYGGKGDVGRKGAEIQTNLSGTLRANTEASVYLKQTGTQALTLGAIATGKDIDLHAAGAIRMEAPLVAAASYLNAGSRIRLTAGGNIGAGGAALRILGNGTPIDAEVASEISLKGEKSGDLVLGTIRTREANGAVKVTHEGGAVKLAKGGDAPSFADVRADSIELKAKSADLTDGSLAGKTVTVEAADTITQANTEKSVVRASDKASFTVGAAGKAGGSIHMLSEKNTFDKANVRAADEAAGLMGNVELVTNAASGLTVNFGAGSAGTLKVKGIDENRLDVRVKNLAKNQSLTLEGKLKTIDAGMAFTSGGSLIVKTGAEYTSARNMALAAQEDVTLENGATLDAEESLLLGAGRSVLAAGSLKVKGGILAEAKAGNVYLHQTEAQNGNIRAHAENGNITMDEVLTHKGGIAAEAKKGDVVIGTAKAENGVVELKAANGKLTAEVLQAKENITAEGKDVAMKRVTAEKDLMMTAANKLTTADEVSAANITLAGGDITTAKKVNARNDMTLTAANSLKAADKLTADGNIAASSANGNIDLAAAEAKGGIDLKATNGTLTAEALQAKGSIAAVGKDVEMKKVNAGSDLTLTAANSLTTEAEISAEQNMKLTGGDVTTQKEVKAGSNLTLTAANSLKATDKLTAGGNIAASSENGNIDLAAAEAKGGIDLKAANGKLTAAVLQAQGSIAVAGKDVEMKQQVIAGKDLTLKAAKNLTTADKLSADQNMTLTGSDVTTLKQVTAGKDLKMTASNKLTTADEVSAANITLTGGDVTTQKEVKAGNALTMAATNSLTSADKLTAGGNIVALSTNGNIDLTAAEAKGDIDLKATNGKLTAEALQAQGSIAAAGKDVEMKKVTAGSDLTLTAANSLTTADKLKAGGSIAASSENGNIDLAAAEATGGIDLKATNGKLTAEALQAQGSIAAAGKDVEMKQQVIAGKDLTLKAANRLTTADKLSADQNMALTGSDVTTQKQVTAEKDLTMTASNKLTTADEVSAANITLTGGDVTTQKEVKAGNDLTMAATNSLTSADKLTAGGNITASSANGNIDIAAAEAKGGIDLKATNGTLTAEALQAKGSIAAAGKDVEMKKVTAGNDLTLTAANSLTTEAEISAEQNMKLTGGDVTTQKEVKAGSNLTLTAANKLTTADKVSAANIMLTGGDITTAKTVNAGSNLTLTAANSLKATDKLTAGGNIAASSENGNIDINAAEATGGIDLNAANGKLTVEALQAKGSIAAAGKDVEMKQQVIAGKDLTLKAAKSLTTADKLSADQNMTLTGSDVTTQKEVKAGNDLTMAATNSLTSADKLTADGNITASSANGNIDLAAAEAKGSIDLKAANGKLTAEALQAQGSIAAAGKDVEMKQQVIAGKDLTLKAANSLTAADKLSADQNMTLTGSDVTTQKQVTAGSDLTMTAANSLTTEAEISAEQNMKLTGRDVTTQKEVKAGSDLTLTAANSLKAIDKLTAGGNIAASSENGNIDINAAEAKGGIDLKATNGKLTAKALQAQGSIAAAGKDVEMKKVTAEKDLTLTAANKLTTADEVSAANITLTGGDITTAKKVTAGSDLTLTAANSLKATDKLTAGGNIAASSANGNIDITAAEAKGGIDLKATNGKLTAEALQAKGSIAAAGKDVAMKKVTAGSDLTLTATNSLKAADRLTAGGNIAASSTNGNIDLAAAEAKGGIDLKAANGKLTAEALQAKGSIAAAGKDVEMKKVTAEKDLTLTAANKLTTADEVSAAANMTLTGSDVTTQKEVKAGNDLKMTAANSLTSADKLTAGGNIAASSANGNIDITAAEAKGGIDLKATNGTLTAEVLQAQANIVAAGKDVAMKQATAGNNLMLTATNSLTVQETLEAGGLVSASQIGGNGDITLRNVKAGSFYAEHSGKGDLRADDVYSHRVGFVHHEGVGDIRLDKMQVGHIARIRHTGTGDIFTRYLLAGREAHFLNRDGGMDLGFVDGGRRLTILDLSKQAKVRANVLRAGELLTIFSLHQEIDQFDTPTLLDLILAGDQTRQAVGWRGAAELGSLFETYWRRYEPLEAESFIDLRSWERTFAESVQANAAGEEAVTIGEDA